MGFDFNSIESSSNITEEFDKMLAELLLKDVEHLNRHYYKDVFESDTAVSYYYNYANLPFYLMTTDFNVIHFNTRHIRTNGKGAWATLKFWATQKEYIHGNLYIDYDAYYAYDFFIGLLGYAGDGDYYGFTIDNDSIYINFQYIEDYMNVVKHFTIEFKNTAYNPSAKFRMDTHMRCLNNVHQYIKFLKFCSTYEDNEIFPIKFNLSFAMTIAYNLVCENNWTLSDLNDISNSLKNIITQNHEITDYYLSPKELSTILQSKIINYNNGKKKNFYIKKK